MTSHISLLFLFLIAFISPLASADHLLVSDQQPQALLLPPVQPSPQENWAIREIQHYVRLWTGAELPLVSEAGGAFTILLGTPDSQPLIAASLEAGTLQLPASLGSEGYTLHTTRDTLTIAAHTGTGVLYGAYALLEQLIREITGLWPADLDFVVPTVTELRLGDLDVQEVPFYPVRSTLETEDPDWLARHRINMSGAEGVWNGTGIDDGLGTAFKYVNAPRFESYQDEPADQRRARIQQLQSRFARLAERGIRPYLFMYVTGEPTKALIANHPDLLAPPVSYGASGNLNFYRPLCWTNPDVHALVTDLIQEIVHTYPNLGGVHLRSWGWETRAPHDPGCAGEDDQQQLWKLYQTITGAARSVRPDFGFYLSGYNRSWLKDPEGEELAKLPPGVLISQKWGIDGEPIPDPGLSLPDLDKISRAGAQLLVLSHDTEETMPLWMLEGDLFVQGVRQYAFLPGLHGLGGFTLQGQPAGLSYLDKLLSARLTWDPRIDYEALLQNHLQTHFGAEAAVSILQALRINSWTLSSFFRDYAYTLSVTGGYGRGSSGAATRFWELVGPVPLQDMLNIPDLRTAEKARERLTALLPQQQSAVNEIQSAAAVATSHSASDQQDLEDTVTLMQIWQNLFESRLKIAEALALGFQGATAGEVERRLDSALEFSKSVHRLIGQMQEFVRVFGFQTEYYRQSLLEALEGEIALLENTEAEALVHSIPLPDRTRLLEDVLNHPNPLGSEGTTFFYRLRHDADSVTLRIYSVSGRLIWQAEDLPTQQGDQEFDWDGKDQGRDPLPNGAYLYLLTATSEKESLDYQGKLAILR